MTFARPASRESEDAAAPNFLSSVFAEKLWIKYLQDERRASLIAIGLIALLSFFAFCNTFGNEFVFDDREIIVKNDLIKSLLNIPEIFNAGYWTGSQGMVPGVWGTDLYRPLTVATYAVNYAMGRLQPFGYHLVNLLLQWLVSVFLFTLARQLGFSWSGALAASLLFATHPLHTEAVTGIVGRAELLMALGVLLALRWYIAGFEAEDRQEGIEHGFQLRFMIGSWAAFAMALLSKEQAMTLPFLLILYDFSTRRIGGGRKRIWVSLVRHVPYFFILGMFLVLRGEALKTGTLFDSESVGYLENPLVHAAWYPRLLTAVKVAGRYLWLCVWPLHLSADYSYNAIPLASSIMEPAVLGSLAAWGALLGLAVWSYFKGSRRAFFAVGLAALAFLPASNLLILIGTIMGERLFYLPSAGFALLVAAAWDAVEKKAANENVARWVRPASVVALASVLVFFTAKTYQRNRDWRDAVTLYRAATQVVPGDAKMHYNAGAANPNIDEGLKEFEIALRIYPDYVKKNGLFAGAYGTVLLAKGRVDEAMAALETAVVKEPKRADFDYNLGLAYTERKRWDEAEKAYEKAKVLDLQDPGPRNGLSFVLYKQGRYQEALSAAEEALRVKPNFWEARFNEARSLEALGRFKEAAQAYNQLLQLKSLPTVRRHVAELQRQFRE